MIVKEYWERDADTWLVSRVSLNIDMRGKHTKERKIWYVSLVELWLMSGYECKEVSRGQYQRWPFIEIALFHHID